jgi:MFS family permease
MAKQALQQYAIQGSLILCKTIVFVFEFHPLVVNRSSSASLSMGWLLAVCYLMACHTNFDVLVVCADAFFYWLSQPAFPYLSKELGADTVVFGYLQSFNSLVMMIGSPLIGKVMDRYGAKYVTAPLSR